MGCSYDFIANTADGACAIDRHQTIVLWNASAAALTGHRMENVLGKKCFAVLCGLDANHCALCKGGCSVFEAARRLEPPPAVELATTTAEGAELWLSVSSILVPSRRHDLSVLVHLFREVTRGHEIDRVVREFAAVVAGLSPSAASARTPDADRSAAAANLTRREREILRRLAQGESTEAMAQRLFISPRTVRNHVGSILDKLDVHSRLEAVTLATRQGLV